MHGQQNINKICVDFILGGRDLVLQYWGAWPCNALFKHLSKALQGHAPKQCKARCRPPE